jgi:EAL domain-containing protein (putative c-di-GMP-specific phosphodiesterase class I)
LCENIEQEEEAFATAQRVVAALSDPFVIGSRTLSIRGSIGITFGGRGHSIDADELLRQADTAMYAAKTANRGGYRTFEPLMHARQLQRLELETELRKAIERGELHLVYQPIFDLRSMQPVGIEALIRWHHEGRDVAPEEFIPLAEESGQIVGLGRWIRAKAFSQLSDWHHDSDSDSDKMGVSVNVSARELSEPGFVDSVAEALGDATLDPRYLTLEITESLMLTDETVAVAALRKLRHMGVNVAVDDFGTGYSSLSYLQRLPVNGLKIDRSFIAGLGIEREKTAIVGATIGFAQALDLTVTAEGVENDTQLRRLRRLGCARAQGFGLARPMASDQISAMRRQLVA